MSKPRLVLIVATMVAFSVIARTQDEKPLQIYAIDVEGGQATLLVSPSGQSILIDAGFPGPRDADRIAAAAQDAGIRQIEYFVNTHLHADHFGSIPDLVKKVPVQHFIDNGSPVETGERSIASFQTYAAVRDKGARHTIPKPGDTIPISGVDVHVVIAGGVPIPKPLPGAGAANASCRDWVPLEEDKTEDARSIGLFVRLGSFTFLDLGDLTWNKEHELVCPNNLIGTVDVYLATRHGLNGTGSPVAVHAFRPRVAVFNNSGTKGASREHWTTVKRSPGLEDMWQLHVSMPRKGTAFLLETTAQGGKDVNAPDPFIANLDDTTANYLKISAHPDGSFAIANPRTGAGKEYKTQRRRIQ